jgi:hypothetical protein
LRHEHIKLANLQFGSHDSDIPRLPDYPCSDAFRSLVDALFLPQAALDCPAEGVFGKGKLGGEPCAELTNVYVSEWAKLGSLTGWRPYVRGWRSPSLLIRGIHAGIYVQCMPAFGSGRT